MELLPINEAVNLNKHYSGEIMERLWYEYFCPAIPVSNYIRNFIREQYNTVAKIENKLAGFKQNILLTPSTRWVDKSGYPAYNKKIYVDVKLTSIPYQIKNVKQSDIPEKPKQEYRRSKIMELQQVGRGLRPEPKSGTQAEILSLYLQGKTKDEIEQSGYSRQTAGRVIWEYNKRLKTKS